MNKSVFLNIAGYLFSVPLIIILFLMSRSNYILYHSIIEITGIVIACGVFMIAYNSRMYMKNNFILLIGISFLFISILNFFHLLAYKGMGVFPDNNPDIPTQLWIASGYLRAVTFLAAPVLSTCRFKIRNIFLVYSIVTALLIFSIFKWKVFPPCFIEGSGLTAFKIASEYVISLLLLISIFIVFKNRDRFDRIVWKLLIATMMVSIASGMTFTLYTDVYGFSNFVGHILSLTVYGIIYKAVIHTGLRKPYDLLFRDIKQNEEKLLTALSEIKTLKGIIPICSSCKKIRNDKGYWQKVEEYLGEHSDAKFSHGICMDCAKKLYPKVFHDEEEENNQMPGNNG
jgi:hypothetical protein